MWKRNESRRQKKTKSMKDALNKVHNALANLLFQCNQSSPLDNYRVSDSVYGLTDTPWFSVEKHEISTIICNFDSNDALEFTGIDWSQVPSCLDPAAGELNIARATRKRAQVSSLVFLCEKEMVCRKLRMHENSVVVEVGAGTGHLCLLLALRNPEVKFVLMERKEFSVAVAAARISQSGLTNVSICCEDIERWARSSSISVGLCVGLHCCGFLTDLALRLSVLHRASFVISPCCYGQIGKPFVSCFDSKSYDSLQEAENDVSALIAQTHRSSFLLGRTDLVVDCLPVMASGADITVSFEGFEGEGRNEVEGDDWDAVESENGRRLASKEFKLAKACMRVVDLDRVLCVCEHCADYSCRLSSLRPLSCSPKNNVIIGRCRVSDIESISLNPTPS